MPNFILVHYDDDISEVVPIGYVKNKEAENVRKHGKYKIAWCVDISLKNQEPPEGAKYYKGVVLQLIDTLKEAQSIRSTRIAEVSAAGEKESAKTLGKTQKANAALGQVTNWDEILKAHNKEVRKNPAFAGGDLPVPAGASDDENADEMAKLREKYRKAKNKVRRLKEELQTVTELNRDLQRALVRKEEQVRAVAPVAIPAPAPPPVMERAAQPAAAFGPVAAPVAAEAFAAAGSSNEPMYELLTYTEEGDMMNFTDVGVKLQRKAWDSAMDPKIGSSLAIKNLATSVWGSDVLLTRTVTGVPSNANKEKESRPPLTPKKVAFLRECLIKKLHAQAVHPEVVAAQATTTRVNRVLGEKINDLRRRDRRLPKD
ncbi:BEN domain-containing protein 5-like isoform X2 [Ixodes scapularis]|uniref:BEN domain-containing protein 5-like isoform X2 n=1 Tax=Ixodes scapularis TaxID=6945 RepID=UPI001A9D37A2|nr:BEN domain-containing protein 5-like isoform X2 [Ixodes scapularis]